MLRCIACGNDLECAASGFICSACGKDYPFANGICSFSKEEFSDDDYFPIAAFERLYNIESNNFWFRARNSIIGNAVKNYLPLGSKIIEVGCGTGYVSSFLKRQGYDIDCADLYLQGLHYCRERDGGTNYFQFNLYDPLFFEHYDGVCAFDVLEHINDDELVLQNLNDSLKAGGFIFITVPASKYLWSKVDEAAKHKRRYNRDELVEKVNRAGFEIRRINYFMTILYPFLFISRRLFSMNRIDTASNEIYYINPLLNNLLFYIFMFETKFLRNIDFPFGCSILCVAQKVGRVLI